MSRLLMSAAVAALMSAPAMAQADNAQARTQAAPDAADWKTSHAWVNAAVYDEAGDQVGVVNQVRLSDSGDGVRALVLDTAGFLDEGMRHIRLLSDEATVITRDALPAGWTVMREGRTGTPSESASDDETTTERRWWEFGRGDGDDGDASGDTAASAMTDFTLITLDFTADEIARMPAFTGGASSQAQPEQAQSEQAQSETVTASNASRAGQGQGDDGQSDEDRAAGATVLASASDESDATRMASRATASTSSSASDDGDSTAAATQSSDESETEVEVAQTDASQNNGPGPSVASTDTRVALETDDQRESAAERASETEDTASGSESSTSESGTSASGDPFSVAWTDTGSAMDRRTGMNDDPVASEAGWSEDNTLVGQDVYAQDDTRLGAVSRVQQDGAGLEADPIVLIIVTDTMGERSVSMEGRDWSNQQREGEDALTLDYQNRGEFEQNSAPYSSADRREDGESSDEAEDGYGRTGSGVERTAYGASGDDSADNDSDTAEWTDSHEWVNTAVYSRTGEKIGEIERVRGGANAQNPSAIVLETGGFLDIGGREVQLSGSNFRLTDYEGEQVLQIRYTDDEIMQMPTFNQAEASDYMLSDNPLETEENETEDDETEDDGTR